MPATAPLPSRPGASGSAGATAPGSEAGLTLMEVLIAVTLLSLLSVGMLIALRVSFSATATANARLLDDRRVSGAQKILEQQIAGFMAAKAECNGGNAATGGASTMFFHGEQSSMRFVSTYSLQQAWRGQPQILEYTVLPREDGKGVRLIVNEHLYSGPRSTGRFCIGPNRYLPVEAGSYSFVLADKLSVCRFAYLTPPQPPTGVPLWLPEWRVANWPRAIRVEMAPLDDDTVRLRPVTVTQRIRVTRSPDIQYVDQQ